MPKVSILWVTAAALIDRAGRVLVQQRPRGKPLAGLWEFPGGKIEADETPERALVRELREELAIAVDPAALVPLAFASEALDGRHLVLLLYRCVHWSGTPVPLHADALRWVEVGALEQLAMPPADLPLVHALMR